MKRPRGLPRPSGPMPWLLGAALVLGAPPLPATVPSDGILVANQACPAPSSIKRGTNAGDIRLTPGERYRVVGRNRENATHFLVEIGAVRPAQRWVAVDCGRLEPAGAPEPAPAEPSQLILAISWQNAFCEGHPGKPECRALGPGDAAASRFSLHGLWPQPRGNAYCGVAAADRAASSDGDWQRLPRLALTPATRARLDALMPGTRSALQRHEWTKHGSCYGADPETYFDDSLDLLDQVNASAVRTLFADHVGRHLRASQVREAFTRAFGAGTGDRVRLDCDDGMISELRISLKGAPGDTRAIGEMMRAAPAKSVGCRGGRVEAAGSGRH